MHYYKRNLGDYAKKAGRLTMLQHGSYTLLIDACYDREEFPTMDEAIEWAWASTPDEVHAVQFVLSKFFTLENGVYVQNRIRQELDEFHAKSAINTRIAIDRETKRAKIRTERAQVDHEPPPNQEPLTNNQEPIDSKALVVAKADNVPFGKIVDLYHQALPVLPRVADLSAKRKALVRARWQGIKPESVDDGLNEFKCFFDIVSKSKFLTGQSTNGGGRPFRANFEWLMNESNYLKVIEGNYHA